jgi:hypothetical protein
MFLRISIPREPPLTSISIQVESSPALRKRIRILLEKYRSLFATTLHSPFELNVEKEKWEQFFNRGPPRVQSPAKQAEILKEVEELLRTKVIEPSIASYYSQVILASKPVDTWRFCIDYRKLDYFYHRPDVRAPRNTSLQPIWRDGPNDRVPPCANEPWDPDISSFYMFLRNILIL